MGKIEGIEKITDEKFVNLYKLKGKNRLDGDVNYLLASRHSDPADLKVTNHGNDPDAVVIYALYGEKKDHVVLIRQYRFTIDNFIYEFPAGLVDPGETYREAAVREMHEETGLKLTPVDVDPMFETPRYTSIGLTDETNAMVFGYASGDITTKYAESTEEIEVVIADRDMVREIMKKELLAQPLAYHLMHFLNDKDPFAFLKA